MSNLALLPIEDNFQTTLASPMTDSASDLTLTCDAVPTATIPASFKVAVVVDAGTSKEEVMLVSSLNTVLNTMTIASGDRMQNLGNGLAGTLQTHSIGATVTISDSYVYWNAAKTAINSKADTDSPSFTTYIKLPVHANSTARDTAIPSPENGMMIYNTAAGLVQKYVGGTWVDDTTGTVANATTTVAGKVEVATQAELNAGTPTGGTGASLVATPDLIAVASQNQTHNYFADTGSANTIAITPTPAITAYAAGQRFTIKVAATCTGPTTVNVNALGAKNLYKETSNALIAGDIAVGQMIDIEYDGTQFQLASPVSNVLTPTTNVVAGEAVNGSSTAQPIAILGNNFKGTVVAPANGQTFFSTLTGTTRAVGNVDATAKRGQSFTITDALATTITIESITVMLEAVASPADYVTLELSADSGGFPGGTIITNGTATAILGSTLDVNARCVKFSFATPPTITSGTTYHWAIRRSTVSGGASALDAVNYYSLFDAGANVIAGTSSTYTASTLTWGASSTTDFQFILQYNLDYDAKGVIADGNAFPRTRLKGFTKSNVSGGGTLAVATETISNLTLVGGAEYYLDTTQGALTTTAPSLTTTFGGLVPAVKAGYAINTTTLKIEPRYEAVLAISAVYSSGQPITEGGQDSTFDVFIETGFQPREFDVRYTVTNKAGVAADDVYVVTKFIGTTQYPILASTGAAFAGTLISMTAITYVLVQAIYENGFLLRIFSTDATAEDLGNLQIIAKS